MKYHSLGGLGNRHLFLTVLEAGNTRSERQRSEFLVKALSSWLADGCLLPSCFVLTWQGETEGGRERGRVEEGEEGAGGERERERDLPLLINPPIL